MDATAKAAGSVVQGLFDSDPDSNSSMVNRLMVACSSCDTEQDMTAGARLRIQLLHKRLKLDIVAGMERSVVCALRHKLICSASNSLQMPPMKDVMYCRT